MKKFFVLWILPFVISLVLIIFCRLYVLSVLTVSENNMEYSLKIDDKFVFNRISKPKMNSIVVIENYPFDESRRISRILGMPGDYVKIANSVLFIDNIKIDDEKTVTHTYNSDTEDIKKAVAFMTANHINYKPQFIKLGILEFEADLERLKLLKSHKIVKNIKRKIEDKNYTLFPATIPEDEIYMGKDHYGPILIPYRDFKILLDAKSFLLYHELIEYETGKSVAKEFNRIVIDGKPEEHYIFQNNYYFILNDKRSDCFDSRILGLIPENSISGSLLVQIP